MKPKIVFAETTVIDALEPYVQEVLDSIDRNGCPGAADAFVSDQSRLSDFDSKFSDPDATLNYDAISSELGIQVSSDDTIVSIATKLSKK